MIDLGQVVTSQDRANKRRAIVLLSHGFDGFVGRMLVEVRHHVQVVANQPQPNGCTTPAGKRSPRGVKRVARMMLSEWIRSSNLLYLTA